MPDQLGRLNVREAARLLGVHENTIRNWVAAGVLNADHLPGSGYIRIPARPKGEPMSEATEALSAVDAIAAGRFDRFLLSLHLAVQDRMNVLGKTTRDIALEEFNEREKAR